MSQEEPKNEVGESEESRRRALEALYARPNKTPKKNSSGQPISSTVQANSQEPTEQLKPKVEPVYEYSRLSPIPQHDEHGNNLYEDVSQHLRPSRPMPENTYMAMNFNAEFKKPLVDEGNYVSLDGSSYTDEPIYTDDENLYEDISGLKSKVIDEPTYESISDIKDDTNEIYESIPEKPLPIEVAYGSAASPLSTQKPKKTLTARLLRFLKKAVTSPRQRLAQELKERYHSNSSLRSLGAAGPSSSLLSQTGKSGVPTSSEIVKKAGQADTPPPVPPIPKNWKKH